MLAISALVATLAAGLNSGMLRLTPPGFGASDLRTATAQTSIMVDEPASGPSVIRKAALLQHHTSLVKRAELYGRLLTSPPVRERVAARAGVPVDRLSGLARTTGNVPTALTEPGSERRASDIRASGASHRIETQGRPGTPVLDVYTQAPTPDEALRLANVSVDALRDYLEALARRQGHDAAKIPHLRQLGTARGGAVGAKMPLVIAVLTFVVAFGLTAGGLWYLIRLRQRRLGLQTPSPEPPDEHAGGDWPRTTRVLPWMLAGFIALLWLTPFHQIQLAMSMPIDMKLDRLVLPFVALLWLLALAAGGRSAPRLRPTWIHAAVGAFVVTAVLSVVLDARYLAHSLELDLALKKLPLLVTYISLFIIAASVVRKSEVRAFLKLTLGLAVVVAAGVVWEYRFKQPVFWTFSEKLLPGGLFTLDGQLPGDTIDYMGRRVVRGPAEEPLECVTMLSLALPIALVGLIQGSGWRNRVLYALAACLLIAGMAATYRKSGLLAPAFVVLTLAYFRRRELLRLAPLGLVMIVMITVLSPGVLSSVVNQFTRPDAATVPTVSDRAADYDAVRPDVWTNLLFGRGWGSYNHVDYRILDSEILSRLIEGGVIGLVAFFMVGVTVVLSSRKVIAARHPDSAPVALIGAGAAVAFLVGSTFYDVMSFPHATYIFLYLAGLVAVVLVGEHPQGGAGRTRFPAVRALRLPPRRPAAEAPRATAARRLPR